MSTPSSPASNYGSKDDLLSKQMRGLKLSDDMDEEPKTPNVDTEGSRAVQAKCLAPVRSTTREGVIVAKAEPCIVSCWVIMLGLQCFAFEGVDKNNPTAVYALPSGRDTPREEWVQLR